MDDLYIKLIANTKKLNTPPQEQDAKTLTSNQVSKLFSVFEKSFLCFDSVSKNTKEFTAFLEKHAPRIVMSFEKQLYGKVE